MNEVQVVQERSGVEIGTRIAVADSWWRRFRGLLARPRLRWHEGMLLVGCASVHTVGMTYPIDVAFLDDQGRVVNQVARLRPWSVGVGGAGAVHALELHPGRLDETGTRPGTRLIWR